MRKNSHANFDNQDGVHKSQLKHENNYLDLQEQLKKKDMKLNPLFIIGHLMRLSYETIRSVLNHLTNRLPIEQLYIALSNCQ